MFERWHRRYRTASDHDRVAPQGVPFVVVTGGSEGIGFAISRRFLAEGRAVLLVARRESVLATAAETLRRGTAGRVETLALDVTVADAGRLIDAAVARLGGYVDVLVNSAGVGLSGPFIEHDEADLRLLIDLNVQALSMLCRHVLPGLRERGRGGIINIASLGGYAPGPYQAAYYASKAFVISLTEALAYETIGQGISITVVAPGPVQTGFHRRMKAEQGWYLRMVPLTTVETVAREALLGFKLHQRVVLPGLVNKLMMPAMRLLPHRLLEPVIGQLLHPRRVRPSTRDSGGAFM